MDIIVPEGKYNGIKKIFFFNSQRFWDKTNRFCKWGERLGWFENKMTGSCKDRVEKSIIN